MIYPKTMSAGQQDVFTSPYITIYKEGDVVICKYADDLHLSLDIAKACVESRIFYTRGEDSLLLVDMRGIKSTTGQARHYMATVGTTKVIAAALITGTVFNRALASVFLAVNKPAIPTRLFADYEQARQWLLQFKSSGNV